MKYNTFFNCKKNCPNDSNVVFYSHFTPYQIPTCATAANSYVFDLRNMATKSPEVTKKTIFGICQFSQKLRTIRREFFKDTLRHIRVICVQWHKNCMTVIWQTQPKTAPRWLKKALFGTLSIFWNSPYVSNKQKFLQSFYIILVFYMQMFLNLMAGIWEIDSKFAQKPPKTVIFVFFFCCLKYCPYESNQKSCSVSTTLESFMCSGIKIAWLRVEKHLSSPKVTKKQPIVNYFFKKTQKVVY